MTRSSPRSDSKARVTTKQSPSGALLPGKSGRPRLLSGPIGMSSDENCGHRRSRDSPVRYCDPTCLLSIFRGLMNCCEIEPTGNMLTREPSDIRPDQCLPRTPGSVWQHPEDGKLSIVTSEESEPPIPPSVPGEPNRCPGPAKKDPPFIAFRRA